MSFLYFSWITRSESCGFFRGITHHLLWFEKLAHFSQTLKLLKLMGPIEILPSSWMAYTLFSAIFKWLSIMVLIAEFWISYQSFRDQFLNTCCLMLVACSLFDASKTCQTHPQREATFGRFHKGSGLRPPPFCGTTCEWVWQQAASKHQASSSKHQAAYIHKLSSNTLPRSRGLFFPDSTS